MLAVRSKTWRSLGPQSIHSRSAAPLALLSREWQLTTVSLKFCWLAHCYNFSLLTFLKFKYTIGGANYSLGHNTDAFDVSSSTSLTITGATVYNNDDCLAVNSGSDIHFTGGYCSGGHGLSIVSGRLIFTGLASINRLIFFPIFLKKGLYQSGWRCQECLHYQLHHRQLWKWCSHQGLR